MTTLYYRIDGQRLAQARRDAFMTQQQLSDRSGISLASIQAIEQPRRSKAYTAGQRPYTVVALANAVGITPSDLLCTTSPQGNSVGKTVGKSPGKTLGTEHGHGTAGARQEHVTPSRTRTGFDLGVDLGVGTSQPLEPKAPATQGADPAPLPFKLQSPKVNGQPRPDQAMFSLVAEVVGWPLDSLTPDARGRINTAAKQLREVGATEDEVRLFGVVYGQHWPDSDLTPQAITGNWAAFKAGTLYAPARRRR